MKNSENKSLDGIKHVAKNGDADAQLELNEQVHLDELSEEVQESLAALEDDLDSTSINTPSPRQNSRQLDKPSNPNGHVGRKAKKKHGKRWSRKKKIIVAIVIILVIIIGTIVAYGYIALDKVSSIFSGNPLDILTPVKLKKDQYGRSNVLVFGTSEDDEGHSGAQLADSIAVSVIAVKSTPLTYAASKTTTTIRRQLVNSLPLRLVPSSAWIYPITSRWIMGPLVA